MKKLICISFGYFFCLMALLVAQTAPTPRHVGTHNKYPIGHKDVPAKLYQEFLDDRTADGDSWYFSYSKYYDSGFMGGDESTIQVISHHPFLNPFEGYNHYSLNPGHEEDIIDAVCSLEVAVEFKHWYSALFTVEHGVYDLPPDTDEDSSIPPSIGEN